MAEEQQKNREGPRDNVILVGQKPSMAYVLAVITQFNSGNQEVQIKARGKAISRAVDVAEIVRRKFVQDSRIKASQLLANSQMVSPRNSLTTKRLRFCVRQCRCENICVSVCLCVGGHASVCIKCVHPCREVCKFVCARLCRCGCLCVCFQMRLCESMCRAVCV